MLLPEDQELLGLRLRTRRPSAVSQVLRAIRDEVEHGAGAWALSGSAEAGGGEGFRMRVASDRATRERAYALAYRMYRGKGYVDLGGEGWCVSPCDADPQTLTLLAEDEAGREVATVSLVFDSPAGLPCDEIFSAELDGLRARGRRPVEVTRLALAESHANSKTLLVALFNFIYIYARRVRGCDDFVIEVNPRHVSFYLRLLTFEVLGEERPCPRVQGAPALLLQLDLSIPEREAQRIRAEGPAAGERTLYPRFYSLQEETAIAEFLRRGHRPMTSEEARYFRLDPAVSALSAERMEAGSALLTRDLVYPDAA